MNYEVDGSVREVVAALGAIHTVLRDLLHVVQPVSGNRRKVAKPKLRPEDREQLERLLPLVAAVLGSAPAPVSDWWESVSRDRDAVAALRAELGDYSAQRSMALGRLLGRAAGVPVGGFVVNRTDFRDECGNWWSVDPIRDDAADAP